MKKSSKETALSAIACAFSTLGLTVGTLYSPMLFTGYLIACLCMMLPLSKGYFKGAALSFAATNALTLLFNGFNFFDTLPYTLFFGLHPIVNEVQSRLHARRVQKTVRAKDNVGDLVGENVGMAANEEKPTEERKQSAPEWEVDWDAPAESGAKKAAANFNAAKTDAGKKIFGTDVLFGIFKTIWFDAAMFFVWQIVFSASTAIAFVDEYFLPILLMFYLHFLLLLQVLQFCHLTICFLLTIFLFLLFYS